MNKHMIRKAYDRDILFSFSKSCGNSMLILHISIAFKAYFKSYRHPTHRQNPAAGNFANFPTTDVNSTFPHDTN